MWEKGHPKKQKTFSPGDYVIVSYDQTPFVGNIQSYDEELGYKIKSMENKSNSNSFIWSEWEIYYKETDILSKIDTPNLFNNRGQLCLSKSDYSKFKSYF